jgi:hypothetical protein
MPFEIVAAVIGAGAALLGVFAGGFFTARNQKRERQQRRINDQLSEFYSPMLALRAFVLTKSELRLKISGVAEIAWQDLVTSRHPIDVERLMKTTEERFPVFEKIIIDDNRQFAEEIMPAYHKMVELFRSKMHIAELSTIEHFASLLEFVEIWDRWLDKSIPHEVGAKLNHSEQKLYPFYMNVAANFIRMQDTLREKCNWPWRKRGALVRVLPFR